MLGSINTGGFSKSFVDAMKDSNYFERKGVEGVYEPRNKKAPVVTGSFKGDSKGFLDNFKEGAMGYFKDSQKKSDTDKYLDFLKETRGMAQGGQFGGFGSGMSTEVAQGLNIYQPPSPTQQMFIPGQEGKGGFNIAGAIKGGVTGFKAGGPIGAIAGAGLGGFMG